MTRINVTPIIDVALVLVIILLVTAPMMSATELDVDLPVAQVREIESRAFISITLGTDGGIAVDETPLADIGEIGPVLSQRLQGRATDKILVVVRADAGLPHAEVRQVLDAARAAGAVQLGIATRQDGGGES